MVKRMGHRLWLGTLPWCWDPSPCEKSLAKGVTRVGPSKLWGSGWSTTIGPKHSIAPRSTFGKAYTSARAGEIGEALHPHVPGLRSGDSD